MKKKHKKLTPEEARELVTKLATDANSLIARRCIKLCSPADFYLIKSRVINILFQGHFSMGLVYGTKKEQEAQINRDKHQ